MSRPAQFIWTNFDRLKILVRGDTVPPKRSKGSKEEKSISLGRKRRSAGGSATAGGINFQAAVTTLAVIHTARGRPLGWLEAIFDDVPACVLAETGGSGDDIQLRYLDGSIAEVQIKRGLTATNRLWEPLLKLSAAICADEIKFGLIVACPNSSRSITAGLQTDIRRLGEGRKDQLTALGKSFVSKLEALGFDIETTCQRLRIVVQHCLDSDNASIRAGQSELEHLLHEKTSASNAWDRLYRDSCGLIEKRGQRTAVSAIQVLQSAGIELSKDFHDDPASLINQLCEWTLSTTEHFTIVGASRPLSVDKNFIPLNLVVADPSSPLDDDLLTALNRYHALASADSSSARQTLIDQDSIGRFYQHCVLVGGPGMGKSTLLTRLARRYAKEAYPVLTVRLPAVAARMQQQGSSFEEALFALGLDGSPITADKAIRWRISNWTILCDGLDECGAAQNIVVDGLRRFAAGAWKSRIVVSTRPVGYNAALLHDWRHYNLLPLDTSAASRNAVLLARGISGDEDAANNLTMLFAEERLSKNSTTTLICRSPLLLGMASMLAVNKIDLGTSKASLYHHFFDLIGSLPNTRTRATSVTKPILIRFLDIVGWEVLSNPLATVSTLIRNCATRLATETSWSLLQAASIADECLQYWQDIGIIEKLTHGKSDAVTFVHKTFAEYAAARFLLVMSPGEQDFALNKIFEDNNWLEVLSFSAANGMAESIIELLLNDVSAEAPNVDLVKRCFGILKEADKRLSGEVRKKVFQHAFLIVSGERRSDAQATGLLLAELSERYAADTREYAVQLLDAAQPWTRLAAWACLVKSGPNYYDLERLKRFVSESLSQAERGLRSSLGGGIILGDPGYNLLHHFIISSAKEILTHESAAAADAFLPDVLSDERLHTLSFLDAIQKILKQHNKNYVLRKNDDFSTAFGRLDIKGFDAAWQKFFNDIAHLFGEMAPLSDDDPLDAGQPLFTLSAFIQVTGFWGLSGGDVWVWSKAYDRDAVLEVLHATVIATGLSANDLARDAKLLLRRRDSETGKSRLFLYFLHVDFPEINWARAAEKVDLTKVETALHFRSEWTTQMAANLLSEISDRSKLLEIVTRLLKEGQGLTLLAASRLAVLLQDQALSLLHNRLKAQLDPGCEHVVSALGEMEFVLDADLVGTLERCLLHNEPYLALAAARIAEKRATTANASSLALILSQAYKFWQSHEEPYPSNGGVVPTSPRAPLLSALAKLGPISDHELLDHAADSRYDVREVAIELIIVRLHETEEFQRRFLECISNGALAPSVLATAASKDTKFTHSAIGKMRQMLFHNEGTVRFAAMNVLDVKYMEPQEILSCCDKLVLDPEQEIRDRVHRIRASISGLVK